MPYSSICTITQAKKFLDFGSINIQALLLSNHCTLTHAHTHTHTHTHTHIVIIMMCTNKCRKTTSSTMVQSLLVFARRVCYRMTLPSAATRHCNAYSLVSADLTPRRTSAFIKFSRKSCPACPVRYLLCSSKKHYHG